MPVAVTMQFADERLARLDYIYHGGNGFYSAEDISRGFCSRCVVVECAIDDDGAQILETKTPQLIPAATNLRSIAQFYASRKRVKEIGNAESDNLSLHDVDAGSFRLVIEHCFSMSKN